MTKEEKLVVRKVKVLKYMKESDKLEKL